MAWIHFENIIHDGICFDMSEEVEVHPAALALWR